MHGQPVTCGHVYHIHHDVDRHRAFGVLHADEPTFEGHEHQRCGSRPDTDEEIRPGHIRHFGGTRHNRQHRRHKQQLDDPNPQRSNQRDRQALRQRFAASGLVSGAERLCGEARSADSQEAEIPVQQIKEHRADGNTADGSGITQMPHYRGIDNAY